MLIRLFSMLIALISIIFFFTQIIWPALLGRTLFPILRSSTREAEQKLEEARRKKYEVRVETKAESVMAESIRQKTENTPFDELIKELEESEIDLVLEEKQERRRI